MPKIDGDKIDWEVDNQRNRLKEVAEYLRKSSRALKTVKVCLACRLPIDPNATDGHPVPDGLCKSCDEAIDKAVDARDSWRHRQQSPKTYNLSFTTCNICPQCKHHIKENVPCPYCFEDPAPDTIIGQREQDPSVSSPQKISGLGNWSQWKDKG